MKSTNHLLISLLKKLHNSLITLELSRNETPKWAATLLSSPRHISVRKNSVPSKHDPELITFLLIGNNRAQLWTPGSLDPIPLVETSLGSNQLWMPQRFPTVRKKRHISQLKPFPFYRTSQKFIPSSSCILQVSSNTPFGVVFPQLNLLILFCLSSWSRFSDS